MAQGPPGPTVLAALGELTGRLRCARDLFGVSKVLCDVGAEHFGLHQTAVNYHGASDRPFLVIDNVPGIADEVRLHYLEETWLLDPFRCALREYHEPIGEDLVAREEVMSNARAAGYSGAHVYTLALPILNPAGMLGAIYCGHLTPFSNELRRGLTTAATYVAIRLAQLQIGVADERLEVARLTSRQREIARRAADGYTNAEVSAALGITSNTVKKHLKDVFERVGVVNRTQLAARFAGAMSPGDFPPGVSRRGGLVITMRADGPTNRDPGRRAGSSGRRSTP